jgi:hypothetical protein
MLMSTFETLVGLIISLNITISKRPRLATTVSIKLFLPRIRRGVLFCFINDFRNDRLPRNWFPHIWYGFLLVSIGFTAESLLINKYHEFFRVYIRIILLIYVSCFLQKENLMLQSVLSVYMCGPAYGYQLTKLHTYAYPQILKVAAGFKQRCS